MVILVEFRFDNINLAGYPKLQDIANFDSIIFVIPPPVALLGCGYSPKRVRSETCPGKLGIGKQDPCHGAFAHPDFEHLFLKANSKTLSVWVIFHFIDFTANGKRNHSESSFTSSTCLFNSVLIIYKNHIK